MIDKESLRIENPRIIRLYTVDSTNGYLQRAAALAEETLVVITELQSAGRGQRNSRWDSLLGDAIFSLQLHPKGLSANRIFLLSQLLSLSLLRLFRCIGATAEVKWPNDILVQRKKVCGVLIESNLQAGCARRAILGVGVNLAPRPNGFPDYPTPAASLAELVKKTDLPAPFDFVKGLINAWNGYLADASGDLERCVQRDYLASLFNRVGRHEFSDRAGAFFAEVAGVSAAGELLLRRDDGTLRAYPFKGVRQKIEPLEERGGGQKRCV